ncbi:MAG TPA: bifunctional acetate--CoA ligase family protein/GNAT family N-acetyltransferase [Candidatus Methylomirabilis sp.]|nr:bifunctional acetate--CoA ligase family protein/GNAT family N-acetyltransferase [Candidatus Methylomirabilis sp.]
MGPHYLDRLFSPRAIAVFGASDRQDSVGGRVLRNILTAGFGGPVFPVNPKYETVAGRRCFRAIGAIGEPADLAVIATPAATVPEIIHDCGEHGVRTAVIHSAGFAEAQEKTTGLELETALLAEARRYRMRLLGPNCLGLMRPSAKLNATFTNNSARPGSLALVSQSGALCTAILDWAEAHRVGFSAVVSLGSAADLDFGDMLDYLAVDRETRGILLYIEGIRESRRFLSALRVAARLKPVVVVKGGRHAAGSRAALSHTGALVGADDVFDAALARAGAVRAYTIEQLFAAAELLATEHRVRGNRLAIVTNAGGPGVLAADRAADLDVALPALSAATLAQLDRVLPEHWSHHNPVDLLGDATPERFRAAVKACLNDPGVDGVLAMLTPQAMTDPLAAARAVADTAVGANKLLLACWMGESQVTRARALLTERSIPEFPSPEASVEAFAYLANYQRNQQLLRQVPGPLARHQAPDVEGARLIIENALAEHRALLTGMEARAVLSAFGIPLMPAMEAHNINEALVAAESIGFPVVLKIASPDITHKSDVNGVRLNIGNAQAVRSVYHELVESVQRQLPQARLDGVSVERMYRRRHGRELHVGVVRDAVFGPVISFGLGGIAIEVLRDRACALPPLNTFIIRDLIRDTRAARLIGAFRHMPEVDRDALEQVLLAVSEMVCELPQIRELDINPLVADEEGAVALDVRVAIEAPPPQLDRYGHMAIHPFPSHLVARLQLADGTDIVLRPIRPEDAEIEDAFVRNLSPQSKYFRFMQMLRELTPEMLVRLTQIDYDRELALIAVVQQEGREVEIAVTRYGMNPDGTSAEFAIVVADAWQGKGIGTRLLGMLMEAARAKGLKSLEGEVLAENAAMLSLVRRLGFSAQPVPEAPSVYAVYREL